MTEKIILLKKKNFYVILLCDEFDKEANRKWLKN